MSRSKIHMLSVVGLVLSTLIGVAFVTSIERDYHYAGKTIIVGCSCGQLLIGLREPRLSIGWYISERNLYPPIDWFPVRYRGIIGIPLWIVFVVVTVPSLLGAWLYRKTSLGHCQNCGYDLTGNVSGVCPECGKAVKQP